MYQPLEILQKLADDASEVAFDRDQAIFTRQGRDVVLSLIRSPGIGYAVKDNDTAVPFLSYVQKNILGLPTLATQITRAMRKRMQDRPAKYVEGPAVFSSETTKEDNWEKSSKKFRDLICTPIPFSTQLVELMAAAGQGKTVLLEQISLSLSLDYQPDPNPIPILLPVDLLGRYIGTIDDAIAGTLNNTILFPLSQKDIVFCMGFGWLVLALDGFDELVARIGARDAFSKVNELVEQLHGSGTIIISARESFFNLHHIGAAIQSFLCPKIGGYTTSAIKLLNWQKPQGIEVFRNVGSTQPEQDYNSIVTEFSNDSNLLSNPFFLTKIAHLWQTGTRFTGLNSETDSQCRIKYVLEQYILRESEEKWKTGHENQLLTPDQHNYILGFISEEMWKSGSFKLTLDELSIATELALSVMSIPIDIKESVQKRISTHAALQSLNGFYSFIHEQFFSFYFGQRLAVISSTKSFSDLADLIIEKELLPTVVSWYKWSIRNIEIDSEEFIASLSSLKSKSTEPIYQSNISTLLLTTLAVHPPKRPVIVDSFTFSAEAFQDLSITDCQFINCRFWGISLEMASLNSCSFINAQFDKLALSDTTKISNVSFEESLPNILVDGRGEYFDPVLIGQKLEAHGFSIISKTTPPSVERPAADDGAIQCVVKIVRWSNRFFNIAIEEITPLLGPICRDIISIGLETGVFKPADLDASGSKKTFFRIVPNRDQLIEGQMKPLSDERINIFWRMVAERYPNK